MERGTYIGNGLMVLDHGYIYCKMTGYYGGLVEMFDAVVVVVVFTGLHTGQYYRIMKC